MSVVYLRRFGDCLQLGLVYYFVLVFVHSLQLITANESVIGTKITTNTTIQPLTKATRTEEDAINLTTITLELAFVNVTSEMKNGTVSRENLLTGSRCSWF